MPKSFPTVALGLLVSALLTGTPALSQPAPPPNTPVMDLAGSPEAKGPPPHARERMGRPDWHDDDDDDDRRGGPRDDDRRGPGGPKGDGGFGHAGMMRLMIILADTDGDGGLSLDEVQAVHARIFKAVDANGDGKATQEEMEGFFHSLRAGDRRDKSKDRKQEERGGPPKR